MLTVPMLLQGVSRYSNPMSEMTRNLGDETDHPITRSPDLTHSSQWHISRK